MVARPPSGRAYARPGGGNRAPLGEEGRVRAGRVCASAYGRLAMITSKNCSNTVGSQLVISSRLRRVSSFTLVFVEMK